MKKLMVFGLALAMVFAALPAFAASSQEADWAFYGQARMWTAWESASSDTANAKAILNEATGGALGSLVAGNLGGAAIGWTDNEGNTHSNGQLDWKMGSTARVGANVKWGSVSGGFEFRTFNVPEGGDYFVDLALLYGKWDFGSGNLEVGKDYPPYFFLISNVCGPGAGECSGVNYGSIYSGRRPQLRLNMGGFSFALVQPQGSVTATPGAAPSTNVAFNTSTGTFLAAQNTQQYLPNIQASYTFTAGPAAIFVGGLYQTLKQEYSPAGGTPGVTDKNVNSFAFGAGAKTGFGPFYINGEAQYAKNVASSQLVATAGLLPRYQFIASDNGYQTEDAEYFSGFLVLGFKVTDALFFEGGASYQKGKVNNPEPSGGDINQDFWFYYLMAQWSPAKNVYIAPEVGYMDASKLKISDQPDINLGNAWWLGIKWQINF
jgi:hypothetical protein